MNRVLSIESRTPGALVVNGLFCGPLEGEAQAFPAGKNAEIYIQLFPFSQSALPLTVAMRLREGQIARLDPPEAAYALLWPDGIIQLELIGAQGGESGEEAGAKTSSSATLMRYLAGRLRGDAQAESLLMRAQDAPDLTGYDAVVPLRFAPLRAPERYDERAGLLRRVAPNVAQVDAALAQTVPTGQGRRMIERVEILRASCNLQAQRV